MDYKELINALRAKTSRDNRELLDKAADAIEQLAKERDAAIENLKDICHVTGRCDFCKYYGANGICTEEEYHYSCSEQSDYWEWRGVTK